MFFIILMKKRGLSIVIVTILLILLAVISVSILSVFIKKNLSGSKEDISESLICLQEVDLDIIDSCYDGVSSPNYVKFIVRNNKAFDYDTKYFKIQVIRGGETEEFSMPTLPDSILLGLEQKTFIVPVDSPQEIEKVVFIPKIRQEKGYCYSQALDFKLKGEC